MTSSDYGLHATLVRALHADSATGCAELLGGVRGHFAVFREAMPHALQGEWTSVVLLVGRWRGLINDVVESASGDLPDLIRRVDDHFGIVTAAHVASTEPIGYLDHLITDVPFSPFVTRFGRDLGVGVVAIDALRLLLPGWSRLDGGQSAGWPDVPAGSDIDRYRRLVELALRSMKPPLLRLRELFDLQTVEIAQLFSVSRQAIEQWDKSGDVPHVRQEKLANLLSVGELLERKLRPGRLPLVARRPAGAYDGLTMLEMVKEDRDGELLELTARAFDWSGAA